MNHRWLASQHEAGHLIVSWYCGRTLGVPLAWVNGGGGQVVHESASATMRLPRSLWGGLVIAVAGIAGEFRGRRRVRARNSAQDLLNAVERARELARQCDVFEALPCETAGRRTIVQMLAEPPEPPVVHAIEAAYRKAQVLLDCYAHEWRLVAAALFVFGEIHGSELRLLLAPRQLDRVFVLRRERRWWLRMPGRVVRFLLARSRSRVMRMKGCSGDGATSDPAE